MATGKLTKRTVDALEKGSVTDFLWDDEVRGFGLRVTPTGAKSYVYQYRMGGREAPKRRYTIGRHGSPWTPAAARTEAERLAMMVAQGTDPADADKERRRIAVDLAFSAYVHTFARGYLDKEWKRAPEVERMLKREVVPELGTKPLPEIRKPDLIAVFDKLANRPAVAQLAFAALRKLFNWAEGRGEVERSPLAGIAPPSPLPARERVLDDSELGIVWRAAAALGYPFGPLFRLLVATGQRRQEVAGLDWAELDRATATWTLPARRSKNGQAHLTPLNGIATELLDGLAGGPKWPTKGLVFTTTGKTSVSGYSRAKTRIDAEISRADADFEPWRVHDIRRTVATGLQRLGVRFEVTEAILNHISGARSGIAGVYQRHDWKDEKRAALAAWAEHIESAIAPPDRKQPA